jgi:protein-disulfide isomerase
MLKDLRARLKGQMRFVFRHFPLIDKHPLAQQAAEAAEAAASQGQFWPMHDALFEHQDALEREDLYRYADAAQLRFGPLQRGLGPSSACVAGDARCDVGAAERSHRHTDVLS